MAIKRNFKMYMSQKSTIFALVCALVCIILFAISFLNPIKNRSGILDTFKTYKVENLSSNNDSVIYAYNEHNLFYSADKDAKCSLNDFMGIENYDSAYGELSNAEYNFIRIPFDFEGRIIDVQGTPDNLLGEGGETYILLDSGYLYMISNRSKTVDLILNNVAKMQVIKDYENDKTNLLILDQTGEVAIASFDGNELHEYYQSNTTLASYFSSRSVKNVYLLEHNDEYTSSKLLVQLDNGVQRINLDHDIDDVTNTTSYLKYPLFVHKPNHLTNGATYKPIDECVNCQKLIVSGDSFYSLRYGVVTKITYDSDVISAQNIPCDAYINDIYPTGDDCCIAVTKNNLYYLGNLKYHEEVFDCFQPLNIKSGLVYGNRHSLILFKNKRLYLYDKNTFKFEPMYTNLIVAYVLRYLSLFIFVMIVIYLLWSFFEANSRYNRYFDQKEILVKRD